MRTQTVMEQIQPFQPGFTLGETAQDIQKQADGSFIVTTNKGSKFLAGGDSGSLMVEDVTTNPHAVGLLFAGSRSAAIANPIDDVLNFYNATMVGQ